MPTEQSQQQAAAPSACRLALAVDLAVASGHPDINDPGGCGGTDLVKLEAVVLPDKRRVPLQPAAILRCNMARAVVDWVRSDLTVIAASLNTELSGLENFNAYECRGRNRVRGAKLSEHGKANALDLRQIRLANGSVIALTDSFAPRLPRERVLASVCRRFDTVLGPGSDGYHEDHVHIDLAARRNGYKICQWSIEEGGPARPPLLPVARPVDAPAAGASEVVASTQAGSDVPDRESAPPAPTVAAPVVAAWPLISSPKPEVMAAKPQATTPLPVPAPPGAKAASIAEPQQLASRPRKARRRAGGSALPSPLQLFPMLR